MKVILASTSRYRKSQLDRLGLKYQAFAPRVDEDKYKQDGIKPQELAEKLAVLKAKAVAKIHEDAVIIGGDQLVALGDEILGKPGTSEAAKEQLTRMAGNTHTLITALAVIYKDQTWVHTDLTQMTLRPLSAKAISRYVDKDQPLDCSGSYKFEMGGVALFSAVETSDPSAIMGLPLLALVRILDELSIEIP